MAITSYQGAQNTEMWVDDLPYITYKAIEAEHEEAARRYLTTQLEISRGGHNLLIKDREVIVAVTNNVVGLYLLYQPGKRNSIPALLIGKNPDGSVNLVASENGTALGFFLGVPTYTLSSGNDASQPYAKPATEVQ